MREDYRSLEDDELEAVEKQTLRVVVQALQEYSREAREIFETTKAPSSTEVIVLAEDLVQYALEVAEIYPINRRFAGWFDYKRVRWLPTPFALIPQAFLVDAKALKEANRTTLQQSQLPLDADFESRGTAVRLSAGVPPHLEIPSSAGPLGAVTTTVIVHFHYEDPEPDSNLERRLRAIFVLAVPHQRLKHRYNPHASTTFFGQGKHSPARSEEPRIRIYFARLRAMSLWRLQQLRYIDGQDYSDPVWADADPVTGEPALTQFAYLGR